MVRFILRILLAIVTFRILIGLARFAARIVSRDPGQRLDPGQDESAGGTFRGPGRPRGRAPKPLVDRASAIDVPFTEERPEP